MRSSPSHAALKAVLAATLLGACRDAAAPLTPDIAARRVVQSGTSITVNTIGDAGDGTCDETCTLRDAIAAVTTGGTISFSVSADIALASELVVNRSMSIVGPGATQLAVRAGGTDATKRRAISVTSGAGLVIEGLTIANGFMGGPGGCIDVNNASLTMRLAIVEDCRAQGAGGGINISGGVLTLDRTTVRRNFADNGGGGVYVNFNASADILASTFNDNEGRDGGGLGTTGYVSIENSTVSGNRARRNGGGLSAEDRPAPGMIVKFSTVTANVSDWDQTGDGDGGGIFVSGNDGGTMQVIGSIIYANVDRGGQAFDCAATGTTTTPRTITNSLIGAACSGFALTNTKVATDPKLLPLASNGGPTQTHALEDASSAAFNTATSPCPDFDQRGITRPQAGLCDLGAYELVPPPIVVSIDIKPGTNENPLSARAGGTVPVAILSSATFDARLVDLSTVRLGTASIATRPDGTYRVTVEDVNGDGRLDLLVHFNSASLGLAANPTSLTLTATLTNGRTIIGTDVVRVVP